MNYDDAVRYASEQAEKEGWILVQDTAWEGYERIPYWIMQGYTTMAYEAYIQLKGEQPTHIFLQAGVGAMAGALTGFLQIFIRAGIKRLLRLLNLTRRIVITERQRQMMEPFIRLQKV